MKAFPVRRPLACLKTALRHSRHSRATYATESTPTSISISTSTSTSDSTANAIEGKRTTPSALMKSRQYNMKRTNEGYNLFTPATKKKVPYALYPPLPAPPKNPYIPWQDKTIARLDPTGARTALFSRSRPDRAKVGDVLMVTTRKGEPFSGAFMQIRRRNHLDTAIQLRGQLLKTSVEMWFKIYSPAVAGIDIIWRRPRRARRARLTYLRKKKHDMGNVDKLVYAWRKDRSRLRTSKRGGFLGTIFEPDRYKTKTEKTKAKK